MNDLPFKSEYAKSGRSSCKGCKTNIGAETLRIAVMVQSNFHDGKQPNWFHESCFFKKQRPKSVGDIDNYENLRYEDQQRLQEKIAELGNAVLPSTSKGKKRSKEENSIKNDFGIEYAKSGRAICRGCEQKIVKGEVRIRKTVYDTEVGMKYGGQALWHHAECFSKLRSELGWFEAGDKLPGFKDLSKEDNSKVKKALPAISIENVPIKKAKIEPLNEDDKRAEEQLNEAVKTQNHRLFKFRDNVKNEMSKQDMIELLEYNNQEPVTGDSEKLLDQIADLLAFGALKPCQDCKGCQMLFQKSGYICNGQLTEWTKCAKAYLDPERSACKIPTDLKAEYKFLKNIKSKPEKRVIRYIPPSTQIKVNAEKEFGGPKVQRERPPLYNMKFAQIGLKDEEQEIKKRISKLGGSFETKITEMIMAIFSTDKKVKSNDHRMQKAKEFGIHVVPMEFIDMVEKNSDGAIKYINSMTLCDWGTDPSTRLQQEETKSNKSKSIYTKSVPKSITLKLKNGLAVDPNSGLEDIAHVFTDSKNKYNAVLGLTDIQRKKNSYYKLQLLESDGKNRFWVFRSWGRIGTTIGGSKLETYSTLNEAKYFFRTLYQEKSGNDFDNHHNFIKVPGCMYPIDIEYTDDSKETISNESNVKSALDERLQSLLQLIFDVDNMKRTMMEFDLDMEKMPLGKLSQKQIQSAYKVLSEIYDLIQKKSGSSYFIDATNRFYTLIPHNFGVENPPLLDTVEQVENLRQVLDSLLEIECAFNLLKSEKVDENVNPLDKHYETLKTKMEPLDKNSDEFKLLQKYVQNTHADTHKMYELEIEDIFKVSRQGESRRYKPFKKLHNRKLLWHGSRLTNFVGILSHGLKIAPPEAPATGYMFGKGVYFADMVSKSANYCCTSTQNSTGLMLLSEVALGDMMECTSAKYVTKLPNDKHSCFGRGRTMPNPTESHRREDGVEIPFGKSCSDPNLQSSLLYNEFIVYDVAQINIQYLLRMNFKYNY